MTRSPFLLYGLFLINANVISPTYQLANVWHKQKQNRENLWYMIQYYSLLYKHVYCICTVGLAVFPNYELQWFGNKNLFSVTTNLSSLAASEVVHRTTSGAVSDDKFLNMTTFLFQWMIKQSAWLLFCFSEMIATPSGLVCKGHHIGHKLHVMWHGGCEITSHATA